MLRKIVVATDRSEASSYVLEHALMLARATGAHLGLLSVTDPDETNDVTLPSYLEHLEPYLDEGEPDPRCYVGHFEEVDNDLFGIPVAKATAAGVSTDCIHCFGDPERTICDFAEAWDADLIVLGRRGRSGITEFFLGSVSNYTLHHAPCSVYIVQYPTDRQSETEAENPVEVSL